MQVVVEDAVENFSHHVGLGVEVNPSVESGHYGHWGWVEKNLVWLERDRMNYVE